MPPPLRSTAALLSCAVLAACGQSAQELPGSASRSPTPNAASVAPSGPGSLSAAATPEGWSRVTVAEQGFSVAVPDDWQPLSADALSESGALEEMLDANPDAAGPIEQARGAIEGGQMALFAFDASAESVGSGFTANVNVINVGVVEGSAEDAAADIKAAIEEQVPVTGDVSTETVTLPAGDAALIRYEWAVATPDGPTADVSVMQYAILGEDSGFVLSLSTSTETLDEYASTFRGIAESFAEER